MTTIHPYATDSSERDTWAIYIAVTATLAAYAVHGLVEAKQHGVPGWLWWVEIPGPITLYLILRGWMDESGWAFPLFHRLHLVRIPNLNGKWIGSLKSSHEGNVYHCQIVIRQTWTRIAIVLTTDTSRSENLVAGILINGADDALLVYEFNNEPIANAPRSMEAHRGHATLRLEKSDDSEPSLKGDYYSGRGRLTTGTITVRRVAAAM